MAESWHDFFTDANNLLTNIPTFLTSLSRHSNLSAPTAVHFKHVKLSHSVFSDVNPEAHSLLLFMRFSKLYNLLILALVRLDSTEQHSLAPLQRKVWVI